MPLPAPREREIRFRELGRDPPQGEGVAEVRPQAQAAPLARHRRRVQPRGEQIVEVLLREGRGPVVVRGAWREPRPRQRRNRSVSACCSGVSSSAVIAGLRGRRAVEELPREEGGATAPVAEAVEVGDHQHALLDLGLEGHLLEAEVEPGGEGPRRRRVGSIGEDGGRRLAPVAERRRCRAERPHEQASVLLADHQPGNPLRLLVRGRPGADEDARVDASPQRAAVGAGPAGS